MNNEPGIDLPKVMESIGEMPWGTPWAAVGSAYERLTASLSNCSVYIRPIEKGSAWQLEVMAVATDPGGYATATMRTPQMLNNALQATIDGHIDDLVNGLPKILGTRYFSASTKPISQNQMRVLVEPA